MAQITEFAKSVKKRLIDIDRNQTWLIEQVQDRSGLYFDTSYLHKIFTGKLSTPGIVQAIREILDLPEYPQNTSGVDKLYGCTVDELLKEEDE